MIRYKSLKYKILRLTTTFLTVTILVLQFMSLPSIGSEEINYIITDIDGQKTTANELCAYYEAGGMWVGKRPSQCISSIELLITVKEGRIELDDRISVSFSDIKQISFENSMNKWSTIYAVYIKKRDRSDIILNKNEKYFEVTDQHGKKERKEFVLKDWDLRGGTQIVNGKTLLLKGFKGKTKTKKNIVAEFFIDVKDIKDIVFE